MRFDEVLMRCQPVADAPNRNDGAVKRQCGHCGETVWLSQNGQMVEIESQGEFLLLCPDCLNEHMKVVAEAEEQKGKKMAVIVAPTDMTVGLGHLIKRKETPS